MERGRCGKERVEKVNDEKERSEEGRTEQALQSMDSLQSLFVMSKLERSEVMAFPFSLLRLVIERWLN